MEYGEQYKQKYRDTPDAVREHAVGFVRPAQHVLFPFPRINDGKVLRYVLISAVRHKRFEIAAERIVFESLFEVVHHLFGIGVVFDFYFVLFHQLDRMEKRIIHALAFKGDLYVVDEVRERRVFQNGNAFTRILRRLPAALHQLGHARIFQGGYRNHGHAEFLFQRVRV